MGKKIQPNSSKSRTQNHFETQAALNGLSISNRELIDLNFKRRLEFRFQPELIYPWWRWCTVKVLLVADGNLNFGNGDFGLSAFVKIMRDEAPFRVRFELTLAHIESPSSADMFGAEPGIADRITNFRFDNTAHFTPDKYDQVWLFGIQTSYAGTAGRGTFLAPAEIDAIHAHMQRGGGVFATGDHGFLGQALSGGLPRVRGMRHWGDFPNSSNPTNEVSMTGPRRNDTNQEGHDVLGSPSSHGEFGDQSDDIPQPLDLKLYSTFFNVLRAARYPHPLLCGRTGRIDVFPDHPHEGECRVPPDLTLDFGGTPEYPVDAGGLQIVPEVIAWSHVPAGNIASTETGGFINSKMPTAGHTFGAISAYDGHRAIDPSTGRSVGRVVCDATWHHFVNVNLIGVLEGANFDDFLFPSEHASKHDGFLSSPAGIAALNKIKNYFTNIGVWISPRERITCFNQLVWWHLVYADRIMEAALASPEIPLERIPVSTLMYIGIHARDAFGRRASQCQTLEWLIDWIKDLRFIEVAWIDPWDPITQIRLQDEENTPLPTLDPLPLVDVALGAALVSMRQQFPNAPAKSNEEHDAAAMKAVYEGALYGMALAKKYALDQCSRFVEGLQQDFASPMESRETPSKK